MSYPKRFRNNPDDPATEIVVYNQAQEDAVRLSGYRHQQIGVVIGDEPNSQAMQPAGAAAQGRADEETQPQEGTVEPIISNGTQPQEGALSSIGNNVSPPQAMPVDRYSTMSLDELRAEYATKMGIPAHGNMTVNTIRERIREFDAGRPQPGVYL